MRNEVKFCSNYSTLKDIVLSKNLSRLHSTRVVNSVYFDTPELDDFIDSEEGTVPRKKIRFRWYGHSRRLPITVEGNLEEKRTLADHREKSVTPFHGQSWQSLEDILKKKYDSRLQPALLVSYTREYFTTLDKTRRYTLDRNICYRALDKNYSTIRTEHDNSNVLELKISTDIDFSQETNNFSDLRSRFSKYCEAIRTLKLA